MGDAASRGFGSDVTDHIDVYAIVESVVAYVVDHAFTDAGGIDIESVAGHAAAVAEKMSEDVEVAGRVGRWVVEWLLNDQHGGGARQFRYANPAKDYRHERVDVPLLSRKHSRVDGSPVVTASDEIVNMVFVALDMDLADATVARDAVIRAQMESHRLDAAAESARENAYLTQTYASQLRGTLEQTRRNYMAVDWRDTVPILLTRARTHLRSRVDDEEALVSLAHNMAEELNAEGKLAEAATAMTVAHRISSYRGVHETLFTEVMAADDVFLDAQTAQGFGIALEPAPDLTDALGRLLDLTAADVAEATDPLVRSFAAAHLTPVVTMPTIIARLLAPRRETATPIDNGPPDLTEMTSRTLFDDADRAAVAAILDGLDRPATLSELLVDTTDADVADLLVLTSLEHHSSGPGQFRRGRAIAATPTSVPFVTANHSGDDLLLTPDDEDDPA